MQPWLTRRTSRLAHGSNAILDSRNSSCTWKRRSRSLRVAGPLDWRLRLRNWGAEEGGRGPRWPHVGAAVCSGSGADQSGAHFFVRLQARNLLLRGLECEWGGVARTGRGSAGWVPPEGGAWRSSGPDCTVCRHCGRSEGVESTLYSTRRPHSVS